MMANNNIYKFTSFPQAVIQAISTRYYGSIKDKKEFHKDNLKRYANDLRIDSENIIFPNQRHTGNVTVISLHPGKSRSTGCIQDLFPIAVKRDITFNMMEFRDSGLDRMTNSLDKNSSLGFDGLVTKEAGLFVGVITADCLPVMFFDSKEKIVGIAHAGYRGILNGILENMISTFIKLGSNTKNIAVAIGPGIGVCCYSVQRERIDKFVKQYPDCLTVYQKRNNEFFLDLASIAEFILTGRNIKKYHLEAANICTKHNIDRFYSYRGDTDDTFGQFVSIIGLK